MNCSPQTAGTSSFTLSATTVASWRANAAAVAGYGYPREELLSLTIRDLRAPGTLAQTVDQMDEANRQGILFETSHRRKDGSTFPVEVSSQGATIDGKRTLVSVVRDITERKQADALRESGGFIAP
jgi:PAS domain S-box-containing protein